MNLGDKRDLSQMAEDLGAAALKKEKLTPLLHAFGVLKANVTIRSVVKERLRQNICNIPFSQQQNNTQVVQNSLLSQ